MLLIELIHAGTVVEGNREEIHDYLQQQHYVYLATIGQSHSDPDQADDYIYLGADDVFVRRDLLRSKYRLVDYEAAEEYSWFCRHYSHSNCRLTALGLLSGERGRGKHIST